MAGKDVLYQEEFLPAGWASNRQATEQLGVGLESLTRIGWKWRAMLREIGKRALMQGGERCNIYSIERIERIRAAQAAAAVKPAIPERFVDKRGPARCLA